MPDVTDEQQIRKRAAAAEHTARVAGEADDAVALAEQKVEKCRADLNAARDGLTALKQQAKEAHAEADEAASLAREDGWDGGSVEPANVTRAQAQSASVGASAKRVGEG